MCICPHTSIYSSAYFKIYKERVYTNRRLHMHVHMTIDVHRWQNKSHGSVSGKSVKHKHNLSMCATPAMRTYVAVKWVKCFQLYFWYT